MLDTMLQDLMFSAGLMACCGLIFFCFSSVPSVRNMKGPSVAPHIGSMWLVFDFKEAYWFRDCLESQKRFWILRF